MHIKVLHTKIIVLAISILLFSLFFSLAWNLSNIAFADNAITKNENNFIESKIINNEGEPVSPITTFYANGGKFLDGTEYKDVDQTGNETYYTLSLIEELPVWEGHDGVNFEFLGWYTESEAGHGVKVDRETPIEPNNFYYILYAHWANTKEVDVTFHWDEGTPAGCMFAYQSEEVGPTGEIVYIGVEDDPLTITNVVDGSSIVAAFSLYEEIPDKNICSLMIRHDDLPGIRYDTISVNLPLGVYFHDWIINGKIIEPLESYNITTDDDIEVIACVSNIPKEVPLSFSAEDTAIYFDYEHTDSAGATTTGSTKYLEFGAYRGSDFKVDMNGVMIVNALVYNAEKPAEEPKTETWKITPHSLYAGESFKRIKFSLGRYIYPGSEYLIDGHYTVFDFVYYFDSERPMLNITGLDGHKEFRCKTYLEGELFSDLVSAEIHSALSKGCVYQVDESGKLVIVYNDSAINKEIFKLEITTTARDNFKFWKVGKSVGDYLDFNTPYKLEDEKSLSLNYYYSRNPFRTFVITNIEGVAQPGDEIEYTVYLINWTDYPITDVVIRDSLSGYYEEVGTIEAWDYKIRTIKYTVTTDDLANLEITNAINATGIGYDEWIYNSVEEISHKVRLTCTVVAVGGGTYTYDGKEHSAKIQQIRDLPDIYVVESASTNTAITHVDESPVKVRCDIVIKEKSTGNVVPLYLIDIKFEQSIITIVPATLDVHTESASKIYDGTALTKHEGASISDCVNDETLTFEVTGTQTDVGWSLNKFKITWDGTAKKSDYKIDDSDLGVLVVNSSDGPIQVIVKSEEFTYDGLPHNASVIVDEAKLPEGFKVEKATSLATVTHVDEGEVHATCDVLIITDRRGDDVTNLLNLQINDGTIKVNPANLTVRTLNSSKTYNGNVLIAPGIITDCVNGETLTFIVTGWQLDVGWSYNTYKIIWNGTARETDYEITENIGILIVKKSDDQINVITKGNTFTYDGAPHFASVYVDESSLPEGHKLAEAASSAFVTHVDEGEVLATCDKLKIVDSSGRDVTRNLNIAKSDGVIKVEPAKLQVQTTSAQKIYDGEALTSPGFIYGLVDGEEVSFEVTGSQTEVGSSANTYMLAFDKNAKASDYNIEENIGTLTVKSVGSNLFPAFTGDNSLVLIYAMFIMILLGASVLLLSKNKNNISS